MSLLTRLVQPLEGEIKLPVHQFMAGLAEYIRGEITGAQLITAFDLDAGEATTLNNWLTSIDSDGRSMVEIRTEVHDVLMLGESGYYTPAQVQNRLTNL